MSLPAGKFNKRVTLQVLTQSKSSAGGMVDAWANLAINPTVWARVMSVSGNEISITAKGGQVSNARTEITIRYRTDLPAAEKLRVLYGGKIYNVNFIKDFEEQHIELILHCDTGRNDGR